MDVWLGGVNLTPKASGSLPGVQSGHATTIMVIFSIIYSSLKIKITSKIFITSSLFHPRPINKISLQSVHNFLNNVCRKQTDRQINSTKTSHLFAKDAIMIMELFTKSFLDFGLLRRHELCVLNKGTYPSKNQEQYMYLHFKHRDSQSMKKKMPQPVYQSEE